MIEDGETMIERKRKRMEKKGLGKKMNLEGRSGKTNRIQTESRNEEAGQTGPSVWRWGLVSILQRPRLVYRPLFTLFSAV